MNSENLVNGDKIQKWYGYQSYYPPASSTVLVMKSTFLLLPLGRYLLPITTQNIYQSTGSSRKLFFTTTSRNVSIVRCRTSFGNYTGLVVKETIHIISLEPMSMG